MDKHDAGFTVTVAVIAILVLAVTAGAQTVQFQSDLQVRDADGHSGTAKLSVGATKLRMDFPVGGETRPTIIDPRKENQTTLSPGQKKYMEMSLGESAGTVRVPRLSTLNPSDPCAGGQLSDCKRLGAETLNGYATEKWEYTNVDGDRETAWIATKLRFPIRTRVVNGATTDITNVVEGPQAATLFDIPRGYAKVDDLQGGDQPGINVADLQNALEAAQKMMRGAGISPGAATTGGAARGVPPPNAPARGGMFEGGPGWVINATITVNGIVDLENKENASKTHTTETIKYTATIPLNVGAPGIGPVMGPQWYLGTVVGSGTPEAEAAPLTIAIETRFDKLEQVRSGCAKNGGFEQANADFETVTTGKGQVSTSIAKSANRLQGSAIWKFNPDVTTYSLAVQIGLVPLGQGDRVTTTKRVDHCAGDKTSNNTETGKIEVGSFAFAANDVPLPSNIATGIKGSTTIPWSATQGTDKATVEWTITQLKK